MNAALSFTVRNRHSIYYQVTRPPGGLVSIQNAHALQDTVCNRDSQHRLKAFSAAEICELGICKMKEKPMPIPFDKADEVALHRRFFPPNRPKSG